MTDLEIEGPYEFTGTMYPDERRREYLRNTMVVDPPSKSDSDAHLNAMIAANERQNHWKLEPMTSVPRGPPKLDKGKQRATEPYTADDIDHLRQHWYDDYKELLQGVPEGMPPWRVVNHKIPLIDNNAKYHYHLPRCPNTMRSEFDKKVARYTRAGWWELTSASQAALMMCIFKKDTHLHTIVDCRQRNENTVKDVTPMLDQDNIREDVA